MNDTFNRRTTTEEVTHGLNLAGQTIVVTGVNSGLGFETLRILAKRGAHVVGLARTVEKAQQACSQVEGDTTAIACELSDLESVIAASESIASQFSKVDVLICNAGIMAPTEHRQRYGLEMQFLTNHIGHYLLIRKLEPLLKNASSARVVITSSDGHVNAPKAGIDFDNLSAEQNYNAWKCYGQSKLANILCAKFLAEEFANSSIAVNALHPGVINTNLARDTGGLMTGVIKLFAPLFERSIEQGAATQVYLAVHPGCSGISGEYFSNCRIARPSRHARDEALAQRLKGVSDDIIASYV
ncbi:MAG: SDR family oxidoreductase [Halioglobus sp.]